MSIFKFTDFSLQFTVEKFKKTVHYQLPTAHFQPGFTLIELLVVIAIIAIITGVAIFLINPIELIARSRDATRLQDLSGIQKAIDTALTDSQSGTSILCQGSPPCSGSSYPVGADTRKNDGTGWVKVNFSAGSNITVSTLPIDPQNNSTNLYSYSSDGTTYELNAILESLQQKDKMQNDGGNNNNKYESGTSLLLMN